MGQIVVSKTKISPEHGRMAAFIDTEGNKAAMHSVPQVRQETNLSL